MACEVIPAPGIGPIFSALTLFECTLTNAQMLVESMADRELLRALRLANSLHVHIMGVMEPRYDRVCLRSEEHEDCCQHQQTQPPPQPSGSGKVTAADLAASAATSPKVKVKRGLHHLGGSNGGGAAKAKAEAESPSSLSLDNAADDGYYYDDDCLVVEDYEATAGHGYGAGDGSPAGFGGRKRARRRLTQQRQRGSDTDPDTSTAGLAAVPAASSQSGWAGECKDAIRRAYKEIKGGGPHLFDFGQPFTDPVNSQPAEQVIARAMQLMPDLDVPAEVWWSQLCPIELNRQARSEKLQRQRVLMRRLRSKDSKLVRRQRSFELVASTLSTDEFDKFRLILSRDYTSSEEETGGGATDDEAPAILGGAVPALRVRELTWESVEVRAMKQRLDEAYVQVCATAKQTDQLRRVERSSGCVSGRAPPPDCPTWAMRP